MRLSWRRKNAILQEFHRRGDPRSTTVLEEICRWAKDQFDLDKTPSTKTITRIVSNETEIRSMINVNQAKNVSRIHLTSEAIEVLMRDWVWNMWENHTFISDAAIQEKAKRIQNTVNRSLPLCDRTNLKFSSGWLYRFKKRNSFKCYKSHGESGDADEVAAASHLPFLRSIVAEYALNDIFNADEFGLWHSRAPTSTIGPTRLNGMKLNKDRTTFLICANADGTERLPPLVVGRAQRPMCFRGLSASDLGFDYTGSLKGWMNTELFFNWLLRFDAYISSTRDRKALLLIDNAPCNGNEDTLPSPQNVRVLYLPKCTKSILQPLDAGVIASLQRHYQRKQIERAVTIIEEETSEKLYQVDLNTAIEWMYAIWNSLESTTIYNCWVKTRLVDVMG